MEGSRAPSCALHFCDEGNGDIILQDIYVPSHGATPCTYYCCLQWNAGRNGGGYCGIQDHPDGKCYIFSIWDPVTTSEDILAVFVGDGTKIDRFGGEGTGLKSMNFTLGWIPEQWYTLVVRRWDCKEHTYFGFWVHDQLGKKWSHLVTMDFPVPDVYFSSATVCFVEDWHGTGENARHAQFKDGFKRYPDKTWCPFSSASFNVVQEDACKLYNENFDAGATGECYFLQSGGGTIPSETAKVRTALKSVTTNEPKKESIRFSITSITTDKVTWIVQESATPQFSYSVIIDGKLIVWEMDPKKRCCEIRANPASKVEIRLEDILGGQAACTVTVS